MRLEIRLGDADREKHGGGEWMEFDPSIYNDMPLADQMALERQLPASLYALLYGGLIRNNTAVGRTAIAWLARQQAGLTEPSFEKFDIDQLEMRTRFHGGPVIPLGEGSTMPSETTPDSAKPSVTARSKKRSGSSSQP